MTSSNRGFASWLPPTGACSFLSLLLALACVPAPALSLHFAPAPSADAAQVELTDAGGQRFAAHTGSHVNQRIAIVVDEVVMSAPVVRERIDGGRLQITLGGGSPASLQAQAEELALDLSLGEMPLDLQFSRVETIGE